MMMMMMDFNFVQVVMYSLLIVTSYEVTSLLDYNCVLPFELLALSISNVSVARDPPTAFLARLSIYPKSNAPFFFNHL